MRSRTLIANAFRWIALFCPFILHAQQNKTASEIPQTRTASEILTRSQALSIVNDSVKKAFKIDYPIYRVYKYTDVSGQYFCVLTESTDSIATNAEGEPDTAHHTIRAIDLKLDNGKFTKVWEINDFILKNGSEISIWFWTKFCEFQDLDNDGLIDPIIVYGSHSMDEINGNRVKFIIYYKGQKIAIRHQDSDLDEARSTEVDKTFHPLPQKLKDAVKAEMLLINKAGLAIFERAALNQ
ncbi:MAG: hypothetical protein BGO55_05230 [Sphingobacteriales bacterium 50-39]|nr:hypothetical protein [Sphingobacteriales bacterium]OJW56010.1 MAG: hypothetical protein BGO55_05230 [Sphingobacteriales bacterium 50-39]